MKKLLLSLVLASASLVDASTVTLSSSALAPSVYTFQGALVPNGSLVRVGFLATDGVASSFVEFGTSVLGNGGAFAGARPSKLNGGVQNVTETDDAQFNSKTVYVWIYNAATQAAATQSGLFKAVVVGAATTTTFPIDDPAGPGDLATIQGLQFTEYVNDPSLLVQGRFDPAAAANADQTGTGRFILGANVPETSSVGLLALAGLALVRRRR